MSCARRLVLTLAALLLPACSSSPPATEGGPGVGSAGTPPLSADRVHSLADAQALVYANRYDEAEQGFRALAAAHPADGAVHAAYALFLSYRLDPTSAEREARLAVSQAPDQARAHAILCRVLDWAGRLDAAVAEGRRAVSLGVDDPLAHLFLSEALADHGDVAGGRAEIAAARRLVGTSSPAYEQAEVWREQGNLEHDAGHTALSLQAFQRAYDAQPTWVERPQELAAAYFESADLVGARNAFGRALALAPRDATLLLSMTRVSMLEADYDTAVKTTTTLVSLRPHDAGALALAAQATFARSHDLAAAVALLERAITARPGSAEAAAYLLALERYVREDARRGPAEVADAVAAAADDGRPGRGPPVPDVAAIEADHQHRALARLSAARAAAGLGPVALDDHLSASALAHCFYWLFNNASPAVAKLGIHEETAGDPGFSGIGPFNRAVNFGWHDGPVGEDITHHGDPEGGVDDWVNSVYHRFPMMRPDLSAIGFGDCGIGPLPMEDMEFGFGVVEHGHHPPVAFPGAGQRDVPVDFVDNELPDPVPTGQPRTTGYPVTVTFDPYARVSGVSFGLAGPGGGAVAAYHLDPGPSTENSASLLPVAPLQPGTTYTARISATVDGAAYTRTWSFTTAAAATAG